MTSCMSTGDEDEGVCIGEKINVNSMVDENKLIGREVIVLPSLKKMWDVLKKGSLSPEW